MQEVISQYGVLRDFVNHEQRLRGKSLFIICGRESFQRSGAKDIFDNVDLSCITYFNDFSNNPKIEDAIRGAALAKDCNADLIIAVGGGSVLDMAKLIKAFCLNAGQEEALSKGEIKLEAVPNIPLIAIPTTAGSGSEATHFAVVYIGKNKYSLASSFLLPEMIVLDGSLVQSSSKYQKACNALDALAQAIEGCWAKASTNEARTIGYQSIGILLESMEKFVNGDLNPDTNQAMLKAANLAGSVINISKTTAAHAWSYGFTSDFNIPHGHAVWLTLPKIYDIHNQASKSGGTVELADIMDKLDCSLKLDRIKNISKHLSEFCVLLGVNTDFHELGIDKIARQEISERVNLERLKNNPVYLTQQNIKNIFDL